jgi:hypothetical protein
MADVPNVPGVPALLTGYNGNDSTIQALSADLVSSLGYVSPQWGIFRNGANVVTADTVLSVDYKQEWVIADYPLERGAFETYDKVALPFDVRVRFVAGGSEADRQALINSIASIAGDYNLYDVVTPTAIYPSCNIRHYDYQRSANRGLGMIQVDVWLQWVRISTGGAGSLIGAGASGFLGAGANALLGAGANPLLGGVAGNNGGLTVGDPSLADQNNGGPVQATAATSSQETAASQPTYVETSSAQSYGTATTGGSYSWVGGNYGDTSSRDSGSDGGGDS